MLLNVECQRENRIKKKDILFLFAILLKLVVQSVSMSVIPEMIGQDLCKAVFKVMTYSSYLMAIVAFFLDPDYHVKELGIIALIVTVSVVGSLFSGNEIMLTMIYLYGAKNVHIKKIVKWVSICYLLLFIVIVGGSQIGFIENWLFFAESDRPRWGLGYTYPTHTSSVLFMVVLLYCYIRKQKLRIIELVFIFLLDFWVYTNTKSRAGAMLSVVVPILFYFLKFTKRETYNSKLCSLLQWAFPLCAIAIIFFTINYNGIGIYKYINTLLSNRLYYSQYSMKLYGIHVFGQKIEWIGWGGIGHTQAQLTDTYNYVDTSYLKLLLENGLIVWFLIMIIWTSTSINAYRKGDRYLLWALGMLAVYCLAEQWLMNLGANPFVLFLANPVFQYKKRITKSEKRRLTLIKRLIG